MEIPLNRRRIFPMPPRRHALTCGLVVALTATATCATPWSEPSAVPASQPPADCTTLAPDAISPWGPFQVQECPGADGVDYRFIQQNDDGDVVIGHYTVDRADYDATTGNLAPQLWDDHIITLAFQGSRGGLWLMGNWTGSGFVITPLRYTGKRFDVSWRNDSFVVTTASESQRRIQPGR